MKMQLLRCEVCQHYVLIEKPTISYSNHYACPYCTPRDPWSGIVKPISIEEEKAVLEQIDLPTLL